LIRAGVGGGAFFQTGDDLELGALEEVVFVGQEIVLEIVVAEPAVLLSFVNPVSVLHDYVSVEFVQKEFCSLDFSVKGSEQEQAGTEDAGNSEVLVEGGLVDSSDSESADGEEMSDPGKYSVAGASIEEHHDAGSGESVGFEISLEEIIPVSGKHESNDRKSDTFDHYR